jgi:hypothetical protein
MKIEEERKRREKKKGLEGQTKCSLEKEEKRKKRLSRLNQMFINFTHYPEIQGLPR